MYVKIEKYPKNYYYSKLLDMYIAKKYGVANWPDEYSKFERFLDKVDDAISFVFKYTINPLVKNRKQKVVVKLDPWDTWGMDTTLSHIILPMLKQLKDNKHGAPLVDDEDVPDELKSTSAPPKKEEWDIDDNHFKRWDWAMDEMIWTFEQIQNHDADLHFYSKDFKTIDKEGREKWNARKQNGLRLFGKYFESLWD